MNLTPHTNSLELVKYSESRQNFNCNENSNEFYLASKKTNGEVNIESLYKNFLTEISYSNDSDFKTPKQLNKLPRKKAKKPKDTKKLKQTSLLQSNIKSDDLQTAIALSLQENTASSSNTQPKTKSIRETLQQFGFRCTSNKIEVQNRHLPIKKKTKYITPILYLRTESDRVKLIAKKVSVICQNTSLDSQIIISKHSPNLSSDNLLKFWDCSSRLFKMNPCEAEDSQFFVKSLNISQSTIKCGSLLKDWRKIPGRDLSPIPSTLKDEIKKGESPREMQECSSPELFNSDDEMTAKAVQLKSDVIILSSENSSDANSVSLLSLTPQNQNVKKNFYELSDDDLFENDKGICTIESYSEETCIDFKQTCNGNSSDLLKHDSDTCPDNNDFEHPTTDKINCIENSNFVSPVIEDEANRSDKSLNVTDYIYNMLGENQSTFIYHEPKENNSTLKKHNSFNSTASDFSQESIVISDEELNYSSNYNIPQPQNNDDAAVSLITNKETKSNNLETPPQTKLVIKTFEVTPMVNYNEMGTPKIMKELENFGIKPLKRQRGIQILKHIYESTHPIVTQSTENSDEDCRAIKRRKVIACSSKQIDIIGDLLIQNIVEEDLIFERKLSKKISSCKVPLQIAWHNLVSSQPELQKNILLYEPLQLEVLHADLKEQGYRYHIQDLLTFLDKKCITTRTNQAIMSKAKIKRS